MRGNQKSINFTNFTVCSKTSSLEYLNKYWTQALRVINKTEKEWVSAFQNQLLDKISESSISKIRSFLNCYEILLVGNNKLIIEFNEYCEVLQVRDLGKCMLKIFVQISSIIESLAKMCLNTFEKYQKSQNQQIYQYCIDSLERRGKIKGHHGKRNVSFDANYFATKQKNKFYAKEVEEEIATLQNKYRQNLTGLDEKTMRKIQQQVLNIQASNAQNIIREAFLLIESKYNSLIDLAQMRNSRIKLQDPKDFKTSAQLLLTAIQDKKDAATLQALNKLMEAVQKLFKQRQIQRREKMVCMETQTQSYVDKDATLKKKLEIEKQEEIKSLKIQLKQERMKNTSFEKLLKQKAESFEMQLLKQRVNLLKQNQRTSLASKTPKNTDFPSQKATKKQNSQISIPYVNKPAKPFTRKSTYSQSSNPKRKISRIRPSLDQIRRAVDNINQKSFDNCIKQIFKQNRHLSIHPIIYQFSIHAIKASNEKSQANIVQHCETSSQTDQFQRSPKLKQTLKQKSKIVKFKPELQICPQYSFECCQQLKSSTNSLKHNELKFSFGRDSENGFNLKKKRLSINWPINKSRNLQTIQQKVFKQSSFKNQQKSCKEQDLCISSNNENCLGLNRKVEKQNTQTNRLNFKIKSRMPDEKDLNFMQEDINTLFLKKQSGLNFQFLNYNMNILKNKYQEITSKRQINLKSAKSYQKNKNAHQAKPRSKTVKLSYKYSGFSQFFVQTIFRHLNIINHSNYQKYEQIRNFLRYPFSAIYKNKQQKWKSLSKVQPDFTISQLRKILLRLQKIHLDCDKKTNDKFCEHISTFFQRIGITFILIDSE